MANTGESDKERFMTREEFFEIAKPKHPKPSKPLAVTKRQYECLKKLGVVK